LQKVEEKIKRWKIYKNSIQIIVQKNTEFAKIKNSVEK
jgi:hypothetical protein